MESPILVRLPRRKAGDLTNLLRPEAHVRGDGSRFELMETILVVDDEPEVVSLATNVLEAEGYMVISTGDPREALRIARSRPEPLDLLLTDVVMPGMNGRELAGRLRVFRPGIKVLFMSAYSAETVENYGIRLAPGEPFVVKPFAVGGLATKVRAVLSGQPVAGSHGP
jgi:CheY-like chemotaxis protein